MTTIKDMAEAHLLNVQREIQTLEQRKKKLMPKLIGLVSILKTGLMFSHHLSQMLRQCQRLEHTLRQQTFLRALLVKVHSF